MKHLTKELRCLVCQNETLADSQAPLAEDLRREIREQIKAGKTDQEILAYATQRYGDFVLYNPPVKATTYLLWFGPFVLLVGGTAFLYRYVKRRRDLIEAKPLTAEERRRAEKLLKEIANTPLPRGSRRSLARRVFLFFTSGVSLASRQHKRTSRLKLTSLTSLPGERRVTCSSFGLSAQ